MGPFRLCTVTMQIQYSLRVGRDTCKSTHQLHFSHMHVTCTSHARCTYSAGVTMNLSGKNSFTPLEMSSAMVVVWWREGGSSNPYQCLVISSHF